MGMNVLHFASMNRMPNNTEIVRILLQKSVAANLIARDNTTTIHYAATTGTWEN